MLSVDPKWVHPLPMDIPFVIPHTNGVRVTLIEANHCLSPLFASFLPLITNSHTRPGLLPLPLWRSPNRQCRWQCIQVSLCRCPKNLPVPPLWWLPRIASTCFASCRQGQENWPCVPWYHLLGPQGTPLTYLPFNISIYSFRTQYTFPPQPLVISACAELARRLISGQFVDGSTHTMDTWMTSPQVDTSGKRKAKSERMLFVVG